jgi:alpha-beta hydrolase superfamily lysophospholipase
MKTWTKLSLATLVIVGGGLIATTPPRLDYIPPDRDDLDLHAFMEEPSSDLVPGTEKRIVWQGEEQRTKWSVVALHGFSASRQETAPLAETVANRLGANLFETRFTAHGLRQNGLFNVRAEDWLDDVADALAVGRTIGEKVVLIAVSNGATLATSMLDDPAMAAVDTLVMISPNFAPADPKAMWITRPGGPLLLKLISGETRSWEAFNDQQALYWTTSYPTAALIEVIRTVDRARRKVKTTTAPRVQLFYSPNDKVISVPALLATFDAILSPQKEINAVLQTGAPSAHILAGDIISPDNTLPIADKIIEFILRPGP